VHPSLTWSASFEMEDIHAVCQRGLLRQKYKPTALFATNGVTGVCALKSLYSLDLTAPDSIAFVTFDELIAEDFFQPRITSLVSRLMRSVIEPWRCSSIGSCIVAPPAYRRCACQRRSWSGIRRARS